VERRCRRSLRNLPVPPAETRTRQTTDLAAVLIGTVGWKLENSSDPAIHSDGKSPYRTNGFSNGDIRPYRSLKGTLAASLRMRTLQMFHALEANVAVPGSSWPLRPRETVRSAAHIQMARHLQRFQIHHCNVVSCGATHERA
jgi:hypothetical protein